jgi:exonuclease III
MGYQEYRVISLNVNGLHNPVKRSKVIAKMKREKLEIIFWQETHLSGKEHEKLKRWVL